MLSIEETRSLSEVNPEVKKIIAIGHPGIESLKKDTNLKQTRQFLRFYFDQKATLKPHPSKWPYIQVDSEITITRGVNLPIRVHKPRKIPKGGCPGLVVFHGGGFIFKGFELGADLCHRWTALGGIAIDIQYRLAPENPFPEPVNDCYAGLKWVARNHQDLGINPEEGFIVAGESNGADLALTCAHLYRDDKCTPALTGIYAAAPSGVSKDTVPEKYREHFFSLEQNADAILLSAESLEAIQGYYKPDLTSPLAYPVAFPSHSGLPKTYFQVCGWDPVRDCGLILDQVFKDDGVPTKLDIYPGFPHGFWGPFEGEEFGKKHAQDSTEGLKWLLAKE